MRSTTCVECGRVFDLMDENDANEWYNGHDCEEWPTVTDGFLGGDEDEDEHDPVFDEKEEWTWVRDQGL